MSTAAKQSQNVVTREEWLKARKEFLVKEKEFTHQREALSAERRKLPMVRVEKDYVFEGPNGGRTLGELFEGKRQLIVYHFMFDPAWEQGCKSCSLLADSVAGSVVHLAARDTSFAMISRATIAKIEGFKKRMGWDFPWVSSNGNDFNYDFQVTIDEAHPEYNYRPDYYSLPQEKQKGPQKGEAPGMSVFLRDGEHILHTYSTYTRGLDPFLNTYNLLDHTPLGRQETGGGMPWLRHHDKY
jgi:predicted dithiol-disulfide oxidoreductase (DUF899 family)